MLMPAVMPAVGSSRCAHCVLKLRAQARSSMTHHAHARAHDDGGGCIQSIEVLRLFLENGIRPKHTIRGVMFMDEEIAQRGGQAYAKEASEKGEKHIASCSPNA